jgi:ACS family tartrate transporter-like MFS transporter
MGRSSDVRNERRWHAAGPLLICGAVFPLTLLPNQPFIFYMLWSCIVGLALWAWAPAFWSLPTLLMGESAAAVSLGVINCIGNLGGFFGPWLTGWLMGQSSGWAEGASAIAFAVAALIILSADLKPRMNITHPQPRLAPINETP